MKGKEAKSQSRTHFSPPRWLYREEAAAGELTREVFLIASFRIVVIVLVAFAPSQIRKHLHKLQMRKG